MHQSTKLKIEFMEHLDSFVADYIEDGNMDLLYFDFLHIKPKAYGRFTVDLSPYTHILEQYGAATGRMFRSEWIEVKFCDATQALHEYCSGRYTNKQVPISFLDKELRKILIPKCFLSKEVQDTYYYI